MATFDIKLFGAIDLYREGVRLTNFRSQKMLVLLAYLMRAERPVTRDYLAGLGWPDIHERQALGLLRRALHDLNQRLPGCLAIERHMVRFLPDAPATVDLHTFIHL